MSGFTYERGAIEEWLREHDTDPETGLELPSRLLIPNRRLRSMIVNYRETDGKQLA